MATKLKNIKLIEVLHEHGADVNVHTKEVSLDVHVCIAKTYSRSCGWWWLWPLVIYMYTQSTSLLLTKMYVFTYWSWGGGGGGGVIKTTSSKVNDVFISVEKDSTYVRCQAQLNCPHQVAVPVQCRPLCH